MIYVTATCLCLQVDCYSFGMFMYELMTQRTPFERDATGHNISRFNRDSYIISGGRPAISSQVRVVLLPYACTL